jgi:hypothetical protein
MFELTLTENQMPMSHNEAGQQSGRMNRSFAIAILRRQMLHWILQINRTHPDA